MRAALIAGVAAAALLLPGCAPRFEGEKLSDLYGVAEEYYRSEDKFRTDYDPADAPLDAALVEKNFLKLAFNSEPQVIGDRTIVEGAQIGLLRWKSDISYATYGTSAADLAHLQALSGTLSSVIGRKVTRIDDVKQANIKLMVLRPEERRVFMDVLERRFGETISDFLDAWTKRPELPCIGTIASDPDDASLTVGLIFIKSELQGDFRRACLTEEFTQVFGIINDDPLARPSIFNDDQEFIELTRHDEYLLRVLYDPRLTAGMSEAEARPLVRQIVQGLPDLRREQTY